MSDVEKLFPDQPVMSIEDMLEVIKTARLVRNQHCTVVYNAKGLDIRPIVVLAVPNDKYAVERLYSAVCAMQYREQLHRRGYHIDTVTHYDATKGE